MIICQSGYSLLYFQFPFLFDNWYLIIFFRNLKSKKLLRPKVGYCRAFRIISSILILEMILKKAAESDA